MRLIRRSKEAMWRTVEWSFVMGGLSWLLLRTWAESLNDPSRVARNRGGRAVHRTT